MVQHPQRLGASLRRGLFGYRVSDQSGQDFANAAALRSECTSSRDRGSCVHQTRSANRPIVSLRRLRASSRHVLDRRGEQRDGAVSVHAATKASTAHASVATAKLISSAAETQTHRRRDSALREQLCVHSAETGKCTYPGIGSVSRRIDRSNAHSLRSHCFVFRIIKNRWRNPRRPY